MATLILATGTNNIQANSGFTYIELIVVLFIIALISTAALLAIRSQLPANSAKGAAREFSRAISYACQRAILLQKLISVDLQRDGYRFMHYAADDQQYHAIVNDRTLRARSLTGTKVKSLLIADKEFPLDTNEHKVLPISFAVDGQPAVFTVYFDNGPNQEVAVVGTSCGVGADE